MIYIVILLIMENLDIKLTNNSVLCLSFLTTSIRRFSVLFETSNRISDRVFISEWKNPRNRYLTFTEWAGNN